MNRKQRGFTLVEIAIVLVIIGLLLGGILKGQELVTNARVRNVADQIGSVKAAYFAFQDRYRAIPGDYLQASTNIPLPSGTAANGNGDGLVETDERVNAWNHLANAGFISCSQCIAAPGASPSAGTNNSLQNAYNAVMLIEAKTDYNDPAASPAKRNLLKTGQAPANILAEVDRKIDDGNPNSGEIRYSAGQPVGTTSNAATCVDSTVTPVIWKVTGSGAPAPDCGGAVIF